MCLVKNENKIFNKNKVRISYFQRVRKPPMVDFEIESQNGTAPQIFFEQRTRSVRSVNATSHLN